MRLIVWHGRFIKILPFVVVLAFVLLIEQVWGWRALLAPWREFSMASGVVALALLLLSYALRTLRLMDYFRGELIGRFAACFRLTLYHNLLNNVLPMRSGEISFPVLMKRYFAVPALRSVPALLWFRLLDLHAVLALGAAAAWFYGLAFVPRSWATGVLLLLWLPLPWVTVMLKARLLKLVERRREPQRVLQRAGEALRALPADLGAFWRSLLWTWINWVVKVGVLAWVLTEFIDAPLAAAWVGAIAGDLTSVLPFHAPAGIGTYEAGVVAGLLPFGVVLDMAMRAAINLHIFVLLTSLLSAAIAWLLDRWLGRRRSGGVTSR